MDYCNLLTKSALNAVQATNNNEQFIVSIKKGIICVLHNFVIADNQGVPLLTKASPSGKGYTFFVLLTGPHKEIFTNFVDLCMAKEGVQNPRYKGFYTKEEADKALELDTIDPKVIKEALNPDPEEQEKYQERLDEVEQQAIQGYSSTFIAQLRVLREVAAQSGLRDVAGRGAAGGGAHADEEVEGVEEGLVVASEGRRMKAPPPRSSPPSSPS
ncbi:hypothetical protein Fmac_011894 [Flemingia macrophylla]|uniref:Ribonuclease H1 N-terminal domain-containing protein n=1 Tax=Flemingia macrophylla TaxID=520843 RepID=A0ABD1MNR0_9FABA